ncbi:MAG: tandem-95 repeat protein [Planctomycetota bacterium]|nr:tandem-95 repeat protein [Planctomycetota bacterium]
MRNTSHRRLMAAGSTAVLAVGLLLAFADEAAQAGTIYVNCNATGASNGSSWLDAYTDLQSALAAAASGDEIWVAAGTYKPTTGTDRTISFVLKAGVGVYGGFVGTETARDQRNWTANVTTLSGDLNGNDNTNIVYNEPTRAENSAHVVTATGDMVNAVLDGFKVSGGNANGGSSYNCGGGAYLSNVRRLVVSNCTFSDNTAGPSGYGGGMFNDGSPTVTNCTFSNNTVWFDGGGMFNGDFSSPAVTNCTFNGNRCSEGYGGGMCNRGASKPAVTNCIFSNNSAHLSGGGMYNSGYSSAVTNCIFIGNTSAGAVGGGGMYNGGGSIAVTNCIFSGNSATGCYGFGGGGMCNEGSPAVTNCIFNGNTTDAKGGGMYNRSSSPTVTNCILWGDTASSGGAELYDDMLNSTVTYCCIAGGFTGTGNISSDPLFVNAGDLHLQAGSPCIDAGDNTAVPAGVTADLDGNRRIDNVSGVNPVVDMGAYERAFRPWAVTDAASTLENFAVTIAVLTNDVTFNGGTLSITGVTLGASGSVSIAGTQVVYTPNAEFIGSDSFSYTINSGGASDTGVVNVTVIPVADTPPATIYVDAARPDDSGDGLTWGTAKQTLVAALSQAASGDVIWVAAGTYKPTAGTERSVSFVLKAGVGVYGGFAGTETAHDKRNWMANVTTLSGDIGIGDNSDNSFHVVTASGDMANAVVDGFTVSGGNASGSSPNNRGGGACFSSVSRLAVTNCTFSGNSGGYSGGGMDNQSSSPAVTNCNFINNTAGGGGGMYNSYSSPAVANCTFSNNTVGGSGGGMSNYYYTSSPAVMNCTFSNNTANHGGGMVNEMSSPTVTNCNFSNNTANTSGGGMDNLNYSSPPTSPAVTNCLFSNNTAKQYGGGMDNQSSSPALTNCTFNGNKANAKGGGVYGDASSSPNLTNCILWGDTASNGGAELYDLSGTAQVTYSCIAGGFTGAGNISTDPLFVNAGGGDLHLQAGSPCIDAGDNTAVPAGVTADLDGNRRIDNVSGINPIVDMGVYEQAFRPWAVTDAVSTLENVAVTISVLGNDVTFNGGTLSITGVTPGANGSVSIAGTQVVYTPNAEFIGSDSFTYTIVADTGLPDTGSVNVTVILVNDAPSFTKGPDQTVLEDCGAKTVTGWVQGFSPGPPNESGQAVLAYLVSNNNSALFSTPPAINTAGTLTYTPAANAWGVATVTVRVQDNGGTANGGVDKSDPQTFTIAVTQVNDPPTLNTIGGVSIFEDAAQQTVNLAGITSGPLDPAQTLSVTATSGNTAIIPNPTVSYTSPATTGSLKFTPVPNAYGSVVITVTVTDDNTANGLPLSFQRQFTVTVNPVNDAPTLDAIADLNLTEDSGPQMIGLFGITSGPAIGMSDGPQVLTVSTSVLENPSLLSVLATNYTSPSDSGLIFLNAAQGKYGTATIRVTVQDDGGTANGGANTFYQDFTVNVAYVNHAPKVTGKTVSTVEDVPLEITLDATDLDGDPLTYNVLAPPTGGTLSGIYGGNKVLYTPPEQQAGIFTFAYKANDGLLESDAAIVTINVTQGAPSTTTGLSPNSAILNGAGFTLVVTGADFVPTSVVQWGGVALPTQYISATQVQATVATANLSTPGIVPITVANPPPAGGTSAAIAFYVYSGPTVGTWIVTNTNDSGAGSLRQAMQCARSADIITFDPNVFALANSDAATVINVKSPLRPLSVGNVVIDAQDRRVAVNGSAAGSTDGIVISSDGNKVQGLTILGFTGSGVTIVDGKNNVLGGDRKVGAGPNGQGLRIAGNGTYGILITGPLSTGNAVKGCWLGLSASGKDMQANLAGLIIEGGAKANTIGGTGAGERNTISGNLFEGITISGAGTDDNVLLGNIIGANAISETATRQAVSRDSDDLGLASRSPLGNGSTGVFLSKGTQGTQVGGDTDADANLIAYNGGNGLEVRTQESKRNSSKGNRISKNVKGGIALYDGSNGGIKPPTFSLVERLPSRTGGGAAPAAARSVATVNITGSAGVSSGTVEVFTDPETQGGTLAGRCSVVGGVWQIEVDVSDVENITATLTDADGNTSPFAVFGPVPAAPSGTPDDSDGDGVSDALEILAGTDPGNTTDCPLKEGAVVVDKISAGLRFTSATKDNIKATLRLILPAGYVNTGSAVAVQCADYIERFTTLDAKGKSPKGLATLSIKGALTTPGPVTGGLLTFSVKGKDLKTGLASAGLSDRTTTGKKGETLPLPVAVAIGMADGSKHVYADGVRVTHLMPTLLAA